MLTNDVDLKEANERRQPNFTFSAKESCKKKLGFAVDIKFRYSEKATRI